MLFGRLIEFTTSQSREAMAARLSAVVLPIATFPSLKPVRVSDFMAQVQGKRFMGTFDGSRFKLGLLRTSSGGFRVRGGFVVIVGRLEDRFVQVLIRPPIFTVAFLSIFAVALLAGIALSFFGPSNLPILQGAMALALLIPIAVVVRFFRWEATVAEQAIRETVLTA
jgi:hypothetical protein